MDVSSTVRFLYVFYNFLRFCFRRHATLNYILALGLRNIQMLLNSPGNTYLPKEQSTVGISRTSIVLLPA